MRALAPLLISQPHACEPRQRGDSAAATGDRREDERLAFRGERETRGLSTQVPVPAVPAWYRTVSCRAIPHCPGSGRTHRRKRDAAEASDWVLHSLSSLA
uniref:Uncharacterized protein n=1 Tax=Thermogemmatispora argillosa TaxID=2045280 RepID=A0A455SXN3_9CHLR|nr:hypothetical protein KTA_05350 [Thermogemmatispora argillosa]